MNCVNYVKMESEKGDVNRRAGGVNEGKFWDELLCVKVCPT